MVDGLPAGSDWRNRRPSSGNHPTQGEQDMSRFSNMKLRTKIAVGATLGAAGITAGGMAFAYFTSSGSGNGSATAGSSTAFVVSQDSPATGLYPSPVAPNTGAVTQAVDFTVTNPGSGDQWVNTVTISIPTTTDSANNTVVEDTSGAVVPGCLASWFNIASPVQTLNKNIPGTNQTGSNSYDDTGSSATIQLVDSGTSQNPCEGVTLKLSFAAAGS
jgi:hypothetical protein